MKENASSCDGDTRRIPLIDVFQAACRSCKYIHFNKMKIEKGCSIDRIPVVARWQRHAHTYRFVPVDGVDTPRVLVQLIHKVEPFHKSAVRVDTFNWHG